MILSSQLGRSLFSGRRAAAFSNSAEAQQFFNRLITLPSADRQTAYDEIVFKPMVACSAWDIADVIGVGAAADPATSFANLRQNSFPAQEWIPISQDPNFTTDRGWLTANVNKNLSLNFNPSTAGGNFAQNNASIGTWLIKDDAGNPPAQANNLAIGTRTQATNVELYPKWSDNNTYWGLNNAAEQTSTGVANSAGWFWMERTGANAQALYRDDVLIGSKANASSALVNEVLHLTGPYRHAFWWIGAAPVSAAQRTAIFNIARNWIIAVGGQV